MQENGKQVTVKMTARRAYRTEPIWQYDVGHELVFVGFDGLPETFQVHFARNMFDEAVTMIGQDGVCAVPDMYAQTASPIYAWLYIAEDDTGLTKYSIEIPVERRAQITDQEPTPVEQSAIDQAIAALNDGVTRAEAAQAAAEGAQAGAEGYAETAADSAITATDAASGAVYAQGAAETAARNAETSATDARVSREGADQSATAAGVSERAAKASETAAAGSASAAAGSASAAAGNASQAAGYASTASDNARAAAGSATAADTSARAAAGSAADSQQSAQAAAAIAQGAAASAAAADGSATAAAGSAQQAAQTVAGIDAAGAAQVAAIEAKGAEVIAEIPADYSELSDDVNSLLSAINGKADVIISSASGAIASFPDGADGLPVKSLSVAIEPVQDLHGYDSPWPAGGGKNLLNIDAYEDEHGYYTVDGNFTGSASYNLYTIAVKPETTYTISGNFAGIITYWDANLGFLSGQNQGSGFSKTFTTPTNCAYIRRSILISNIDGTQMLELGSTATAYAPYSNICPISGWDAVKVTRAGKNLLDKSKAHFYNNQYFIFGGNLTALDNTLYLKAGTYTVSTSEPTNMYLEDRNQARFIPAVYNTKQATFTNPIDQYCKFSFVRASTSQETSDNYDYQLEIGSTATDYEPYAGNTYDITLPTEAGTVYGGSLTVNEDGTGSLSVNSELEVFDIEVSETGIGSQLNYLNLTSGSVDVIGDYTRINFAGPTDRTKYNLISNTYEHKISNMLPHYFAYNAESVHWYRNTVLYVFFPTSIVGSTKESVIAYLKSLIRAGTPFSVWLELATPQTYTLTASQVQTLLGTNNVWADTGDVAVSYRADTKLYIDNKITQAIAAALNA